MSDYVQLIKLEEFKNISVCLYIEQDRIYEIGEKINKIHASAYMNGYNWEVFLMHYLKGNSPELLDGLGNDPEAGMYAAYYELNDDNMVKAEKLVTIIKNLIENETMIYDYVNTHADDIEWN